MFKKIIKTIKATALCIKFPFLYPRNRFTGNHYNNWALLNFINRYLPQTSFTITRNVYTMEEFKEKVRKSSDSTALMELADDALLRIQLSKILAVEQGVYVSLSTDDMGKTYRLKFGDKVLGIIDTEKCLSEGSLLGIGFYKSNKSLVLVTSDNAKIDSKACPLLFIGVKDEKFRKLLLGIKRFHDTFLQYIHCLTSYTELDDMPTGWRNAFGIQMCNEIKASLKRDKLLHKMRIVQIKEKFGGLRFYYNHGSSDMGNIVRKYETLSYHTCICCGKPATKISKGWISPYCDDCIGDRNFIEIKKEH